MHFFAKNFLKTYFRAFFVHLTNRSPSRFSIRLNSCTKANCKSFESIHVMVRSSMSMHSSSRAAHERMHTYIFISGKSERKSQRFVAPCKAFERSDFKLKMKSNKIFVAASPLNTHRSRILYSASGWVGCVWPEHIRVAVKEECIGIVVLGWSSVSYSDSEMLLENLFRLFSHRLGRIHNKLWRSDSAGLRAQYSALSIIPRLPLTLASTL